MSSQQSNPSNREQRLNEVVAAYVEAVEAGKQLNLHVIIDQHPDLADDLRAFVAEYERMTEMAAPLRPVADSPAGTSARKNGSIDREVATLPPSSLAGEFAEARDATPELHSTHSEPLPQPSAGFRLRYFGDYELLEEIARGGMGVVYKARQVNLKRTVALKMILAGQLAHPDDVKRFYAEAEAAAKLDHPGIVPIFEVGQHEGQHYFSMAFVDGESLSHKISRGVFAPRQAAVLLYKIADAIAYAHVEGVIHRDLKPANVLIDCDGQPRITDFGLAKRVQPDDTQPDSLAQLTATGQILGTPSYMPPEQACGSTKDIGPLADVYSLGAILYCLVTGRPPFQAASPLDTLLQVLNQQPVPPRQLNAALPRDLDTMCLKCLEKDPRRRYGSAKELAEELRRFLNGEPILARPVGQTERAWRWCKRNPVVATLTSTVALLLVTVTVGATASAFRLKTLSDKERLERLRAEDRDVKSRRLLYIANMKTAQDAWELGDTPRVVQLLETLRPERDQPDVRTWDWHYLWNLCHSASFTLRMPDVDQIEFSPDGQLLAVACKTKTSQFRERNSSKDRKRDTTKSPSDSWDISDVSEVRVFDLNEGTETSRIPMGSESVRQLTFSSDRSRLAVLGSTRLVLSNREIKPSKQGFDTQCVALSPDMKTVVVRFVPFGYYAPKPTVAASANAPVDQTADEPVIALWDVMTNTQRAQIKITPEGTRDATEPLPGETAARRQKHAVAVIFAPDGQTLALVSEDRLTVTLWDVGSNAIKFVLPKSEFPNEPRCVVFAPDNSLLATATYDDAKRRCEVKLWDVATGQERFVLGRWEYPPALAFSDDGKRLATGSESSRIWDMSTGKMMRDLDTQHRTTRSQNYAHQIALSTDGKTLAAVSHGTIGIWDIEQNRETARLEGHLNIPSPTGPQIYKLALAPDGQKLATFGPSYFEHDSQFDTGTPGQSWWSPKEVKVWDVARLPKPVTIACRQPVAEIAFAPNDSFLMTRSWSQMVALWDPETGSERAKLMEPYYPRIATKPEGRLGAVAYSPNGKKIVTASDISDEPREVSFRTGIYEKTAKLWDATTGKQQGVLAGHASWVYGVAFSPDGKSILTVSDDRSARLWDADSLELRGVLRPSESWINAAAFSPDSFTLATGSCDGTVKLWNVADAHERADLSGHRACITQIRFDPHGRTVLTIDTPDRRGGAALILWDAATGREIIGLHLSGPAAFSPDGATLAVCGQKDRETHLVTYNTQTGQELQSVRAHDWWIQDVAFAPDGHAIATASWDKTVKVWDATTIEPLATLNSPNWVDGIAFSRVGRKLAARVRDRSVVVWNTDNFQQRFQIDSEHSDSNGEIVFSPDGQTLAVIAMNSPPAKLYETETGSEIATLSGSEWTSFHFAADGQTIVTSNNNRGVTLWDAATYKERVRLVRQFNTGFSVTAVGISPDSQIVVTATTDRDRPVVIWHAATGREQATLKDYSGVVAQLAISPDSKTLATLNKGDAIVRLWDLSTGETRMTLAAHNNPVSCLEFSPNGKWLFTGSNSNEPSILWDVTSGTAVQKLELNKGGVAAVSFSRHSNLLATLGGSFGDKSVRLWDTITWTERGLIRSQTGVDSLAFTADSKSLVLREQGNALRSIWDPFVLQERQILPLIQQSDLHALPNFNDRNFGSIAFSADGRTLALAKSSAGLQDGVPIPNVLLLRAPAEQ